MKDLSGYIFSKLRSLIFSFLTVITTLYCRFIFSLKGVNYGKNIKFFGFSRVSRAYKSSIVIGDNCNFRSGYFFNRMGINKKCYIVTLKKGAEIKVIGVGGGGGNDAGLSGAVVTCAGKVTIGNNVLLGAESFITDYDWHGITPDSRRKPPSPKEVVIGDNVWLGYKAIVLKGVTIGKNSVIGANSVVTKDIPENVIAAGNPCKVVRAI